MPSSKKEPGSSGDFLLSRDSGAQLPSSPWLLWLPEKAQGTWVWGAVWHFPLYSPGLKSRHTYGKARWDVRAAVVQEKKTGSPNNHSVSCTPPVWAPQICFSFLSAYKTHAGSQGPRGGKPRFPVPTSSPLSRTTGGRAGADVALRTAATGELKRTGYRHSTPAPSTHTLVWPGQENHNSLLQNLEEWETHSIAGPKHRKCSLAPFPCSLLESDSDLWGRSLGSGSAPPPRGGSARPPPSLVTAGVGAGEVVSWRLYCICRPPPTCERFAGAEAVFRFCQNLFEYKSPR